MSNQKHTGNLSNRRPDYLQPTLASLLTVLHLVQHNLKSNFSFATAYSIRVLPRKNKSLKFVKKRLRFF